MSRCVWVSQGLVEDDAVERQLMYSYDVGTDGLELSSPASVFSEALLYFRGETQEVRHNVTHDRACSDVVGSTTASFLASAVRESSCISALGLMEDVTSNIVSMRWVMGGRDAVQLDDSMSSKTLSLSRGDAASEAFLRPTYSVSLADVKRVDNPTFSSIEVPRICFLDENDEDDEDEDEETKLFFRLPGSQNYGTTGKQAKVVELLSENLHFSPTPPEDNHISHVEYAIPGLLPRDDGGKMLRIVSPQVCHDDLESMVSMKCEVQDAGAAAARDAACLSSSPYKGQSLATGVTADVPKKNKGVLPSITGAKDKQEEGREDLLNQACCGRGDYHTWNTLRCRRREGELRAKKQTLFLDDVILDCHFLGPTDVLYGLRDDTKGRDDMDVELPFGEVSDEVTTAQIDQIVAQADRSLRCLSGANHWDVLTTESDTRINGEELRSEKPFDSILRYFSSAADELYTSVELKQMAVACADTVEYLKPSTLTEVVT